MLHEITLWVLSWAESPYGTLVLWFVAFIESIIFPIPPDTLLISLGLGDPKNALVLAAVCTFGSVLGGMAGYALGKIGGRPIALRLFGQHKVEEVQRVYRQYDVWAVGMGAFTPLPYKVFTVTAGVFALDWKRFLLASLVGRAGRFFMVGGAIYFFGDAARAFLLGQLEIVALAVGVAVVILVFGANWLRRRRARDRQHSRKSSEEDDDPHPGIETRVPAPGEPG